jgi:hypothetical protein
MSNLSALREMVTQLPPPPFDDLVDVARKRRRRSAAGGAIAAAVVILGGSVTAANLADEPVAIEPTGDPTPTTPWPSPAPTDGWTPERVRAEGTMQEELLTTESGLSVRLWRACGGPRCDSADGPTEDLHAALEIVQNDRSAVFDVTYSPNPLMKAYDVETVLISDGTSSAPDVPVRHRLLRADGAATELRPVGGLAAPVPGSGVVAISASALMAGTEVLYLVDEAAGTMQPMDAPAGVRYWGPNLAESLWGVTDDCRVFVAVDGSFGERRLDCAPDLAFTYGLSADEFPSGWLRPGRMAVGEQGDSESFVHASLDGGETWQRLLVGGDDTVADVLLPLS